MCDLSGIRLAPTEYPFCNPPLQLRFSDNDSSDQTLELRQQIPWIRQYRVLLE